MSAHPVFTEHPQAEVLRWIADGRDIQTRCNFGTGPKNLIQYTDWEDTDATSALCYLSANGRKATGFWEFRLNKTQFNF